MKTNVVQSNMLVGLLAVAVAFICSLIITPNASAVSGSCWFNSTAGPVTGTGTCSAPGTAGNYATNDLLRRDSGNRSTGGGGQAIPDSVNTKNEFINHVVQRFNGVSNYTAQNRVGAAFIIQTMRNNDHSWPSNADRDDWVNKMQQPEISVHVLWRNVGRTGYYDPGKRNAFFGAHATVSRKVIEVRMNGTILAQIEYACGNMVADQVDFPRWSIANNTIMTVNGTQRNRDNTDPFPVDVGDSISWEHRIRNNGPSATTRGIDWQVQNNGTRTSPNEPSNTWGSGRPNGALGPTSSGGRVVNWTASAAEAGNMVCQRIRHNPTSFTVPSWSYSDWRCVRVNDIYRIQANLTLPTPSTFTDFPNFTVGGQIQTTTGVVNDSHRVRLVAYQYNNSSVLSSGQLGVRTSNGNNPCDVPNLRSGSLGFVTCRTSNPNMANFDGSPATQNRNAPFSDFGFTDPASGFPLGTTFCFMLSVENPTQLPGDDNNWYHSALRCSTKAKLPKLQIHGGDLRVTNTTNACSPTDKGYIRTSFTQVDGRYYGSWGEFGALSRCNNYNFTTGTKLSSGSANVSTSLPGLHSQTFANSGVVTSPPYGQYGTNTNTGGVRALTTCPDGADTHTSFSAFISAVDEDSVTGTHCITSAGTLVIDDNIRLDDSVNSLSSIPQVIIIANNIMIRHDVSRVDAWLISSNDIYTCVTNSNVRYTSSSVSNPGLSSSRCDTQLVINGPTVVGRNLYADRTFGGSDDGDEEKASEAFNLPASSVVWWYQQQANNNTRVNTVNLKELPPRY